MLGLDSPAPTKPTTMSNQSKNLVELGLAVESIACPDKAMQECIKMVLSTPSVLANVTEMLGSRRADNGTDMVSSMKKLLAALEDGTTYPHMTGTSAEVALIIFFNVVAVLFIVVRIYARLKVTNIVWVDDGWAIMGTLCSIITMAIYMATLSNYAKDRHIWDVPFLQYQNWYKWITIFEVMCYSSMVPVKFAFLAFYYRLADVDNNSRWHTRAILVLGLYTLILQLAVIIVTTAIYTCHHINWWDGSYVFGNKCMDRGPAYNTWGAFMSLGDFFVLLLPIWTVSKLEMKIKEKMKVIAMFALGAVVCLAGIFRLIALNSANENIDQTWHMYNAGIWSFVQIDLAIAVSCIPAFHSLRRHTKKAMTTLSSTAGLAFSAAKPTVEISAAPVDGHDYGHDYGAVELSSNVGEKPKKSNLKGYQNGIRLTTVTTVTHERASPSPSSSKGKLRDEELGMEISHVKD